MRYELAGVVNEVTLNAVNVDAPGAFVRIFDYQKGSIWGPLLGKHVNVRIDIEEATNEQRTLG